MPRVAAADAQVMAGPVDDDAARARAQAERARDRLTEIREEQERLTSQRDDAIRVLSRAGMSYEAIAATAGVSKARVGQIVSRRPT